MLISSCTMWDEKGMCPECTNRPSLKSCGNEGQHVRRSTWPLKDGKLVAVAKLNVLCSKVLVMCTAAQQSDTVMTRICSAIAP